MRYLKLQHCWEVHADGQGERQENMGTVWWQEEMLEAKPHSKYQVIAFLIQVTGIILVTYCEPAIFVQTSFHTEQRHYASWVLFF